MLPMMKFALPLALLLACGPAWAQFLGPLWETNVTLTRADLSEAVFKAVGLSRNESSQMVEDILEEICAALSRGDTVKLSSFGTFSVRQKSRRMGRNPKTGTEVPIAPRRVLVFRPSHVLKSIINGQTPVDGHGED